MNRRQALVGMAGAITAGLAGCGALTGPDPQVIDSEADADLLDAFASQAEVEVTVVNEGSAGDVVVYVEVYNEQDTLLERFGEEIYMKENERRQVTIRVDVDEDADYYEAYAEAS